MAKEHGEGLRSGVFSGYVEKTLGPRSENRQIEMEEKALPYESRDEEDRAELFREIENLAAERRDLIRSLNREKKKGELVPHTTWEMRRVGGRYVPIRILKGSRSDNDTSR